MEQILKLVKISMITIILGIMFLSSWVIVGWAIVYNQYEDTQTFEDRENEIRSDFTLIDCKLQGCESEIKKYYFDEAVVKRNFGEIKVLMNNDVGKVEEIQVYLESLDIESSERYRLQNKITCLILLFADLQHRVRKLQNKLY